MARGPEGQALNSHDRKVVEKRSAMVASAEGATVVIALGPMQRAGGDKSEVRNH